MAFNHFNSSELDAPWPSQIAQYDTRDGSGYAYVEDLPSGFEQIVQADDTLLQSGLETVAQTAAAYQYPDPTSDYAQIASQLPPSVLETYQYQNPFGQTTLTGRTNQVYEQAGGSLQRSISSDHSLSVSPISAPSTTQSRPKRIRVKSSRPKKPVKPVTDRHLATGTKVDYQSLLFRKPELVRSWLQPPFSYSHENVTHILQYFEQVSQIKGQAYVDQILDRRQPEVMQSRAWNLLDPFDPLLMFPSDGSRLPGVPSLNFVLKCEIEGERPFIDDNEQNPKMFLGEKNYQLRGYVKQWECLPIGTTCAEILQKYPNHVSYEFIDPFLQHKVRAMEMINSASHSVRQALTSQEVMKTGQTGNLFKKRMDKRMRVLVAKSGDDYAKVKEYLNSPIKLRALGMKLKHVDMITSDVDHVRNHIEQDQRRYETYLNKERNGGRIPSSQQSSSSPSTFATSSSSMSTPASSMPPKTPVQPVAADVFVKPAPSTMRPVHGRTETYSQSVPQPAPQTCSATPARSSFPKQVNGVHVSVSIATGGLGHLFGSSFWTSQTEYMQHVKEVLALSQSTKRLVSSIIAHDTKSFDLEPNLAMDKRSKILRWIFGRCSGDRYAEYEQDNWISSGESRATHSIIAQLEAEVTIITAEKGISVYARPNCTRVEAIKQEAMQQQISLYKTICLLLATTVAKIVRGSRESLLVGAISTTAIQDARKLSVLTNDALEAVYTGRSDLVQRLYYIDPMKTAIAWELTDVVLNDLPGGSDDRALALALLEEAKARKHRIDVANEQVTIPLSECLTDTAKTFYSEIIEQLEHEVKELDRMAAKVAPAPQKRPRDEDSDTLLPPHPKRSHLMISEATSARMAGRDSNVGQLQIDPRLQFQAPSPPPIDGNNSAQTSSRLGEINGLSRLQNHPGTSRASFHTEVWQSQPPARPTYRPSTSDLQQQLHAQQSRNRGRYQGQDGIRQEQPGLSNKRRLEGGEDPAQSDIRHGKVARLDTNVLDTKPTAPHNAEPGTALHEAAISNGVPLQELEVQPPNPTSDLDPHGFVDPWAQDDGLGDLFSDSNDGQGFNVDENLASFLD